MSEEAPAPEPPSRLAAAGLGFLGAGWIVAVLFADGFELHRSALASPLIVLGALCGVGVTLRGGPTLWKPALVVGAVAMLYFAGRAILSPVWDLGRHDLHLITLAWLTILTTATCVTTSRRAAWVAGGIVLVFLAHLGAGLYQQFVDKQFVLLRLPRPTQGVSGLFWHWNNLAALLAILLPLFLGMALTSRRTAVRILFAFLVLTGLGLAYLSKSRAGFGAVAIGLSAVGMVLLLWRSRSWSWSKRLATWCGVGLLGLVAAGMVFLVASRASEARGHGADLGQALGKSSRLHLAGTAFDLWFDAPLTGNGSQSFKYLLPKNWDHEVYPLWLGNPETVHNEYLQVLCDYGVIGLILIMGFVLLVLGRVLVARGAGGGADRSLLSGLQLGAVGGLIGTMAHAIVEFQLHLLPILLPAAAAIGLLVQDRRAAGRMLRGAQVFTAVVAILLALVSTGKENLSSLGWLRWEFNAIRSGGKVPAFKDLVESSPHYEVARTYGRGYYIAYLDGGSEDAQLLEEARWALQIAVDRNPYDQVTLVTLGLVLDQQGRHEEAAPVHRQAIDMAAARENKYGALGGMSLHLFLRGEKLWMARKPDDALGHFLLAREYLEASHARKFNFGTSNDYTARKRLLESRITLLQESGIKPRIPDDVPPPPEDPYSTP